MFSLLSTIAVTFQFRYFKNLIDSVADFLQQVKGLFGSFGIIDAVDILVVAAMIYLVIRVVRETRAMQLIKGLFMLVVIYFVANFLGLGATSFIFKFIFSNILIIIVVLFGPDIRNVLEQMSKGASHNSLRQIIHPGVAVDVAEMQKAIDATVKACSNMSSDKIGALIVFENDTMLGDFINSGTVLSAKPSCELVENIFYPKSPLHDGAMIVRDGKIYAAGCILPLTKDNVSSHLGTRHRAAIGMSQQSDAVVLVVSEETGNISVAHNGSFTEDVSTGFVRNMLYEIFIPSGSAQDDKIINRLVRRIKK